MGLRRAGGGTGSPGSTDPVSAFFMSMSVALAGNLELRVNDRDGKQVGNKTESGVFGGKERKGVMETPIVHLQTWLKEIGYSVGPVNGEYKAHLERAVLHFQTHFMGAGATGRVNAQTAALIYAVRQANPVAP
jgi:peptidoglycan hydrolase-like protein with peptidoglycan-binding domain